MAQPNSDREELERLRKKKRLQELEQKRIAARSARNGQTPDFNREVDPFKQVSPFARIAASGTRQKDAGISNAADSYLFKLGNALTFDGLRKAGNQVVPGKELGNRAVRAADSYPIAAGTGQMTGMAAQVYAGGYAAAPLKGLPLVKNAVDAVGKTRLGSYAGRMAKDMGLWAGESALQGGTTLAGESAAYTGEEPTLGDRAQMAKDMATVNMGDLGVTMPFVKDIPLNVGGPLVTSFGRRVGTLAATQGASVTPQHVRKSVQSGTGRISGGPEQMRAVAEIIDAELAGGLRPQSIAAVHRLLKGSGLSTDDVTALNREVRNRLEAGASAGSSRKTVGQLYSEILDDPEGPLYKPQASLNIIATLRERRMNSSPGDGSAGVIGSTVRDIRDSQKGFLEDSAQKNLGSGTRIGVKEQVDATLKDVSAEYERILAAAPRSGPGADTLRALVLADPSKNSVLRRKAKNANLSVDEYVTQNPYAAAHWMRSRLAKDARSASGREKGDLQDTVTQLDEVLDGFDAYAQTKRNWGTEQGVLNARDFGKSLFGGPNSSRMNDPGLRAELVEQFQALSPREQEVALISIRDSALGRMQGGPKNQQARITALTSDAAIDFFEQVGAKRFSDDLMLIKEEQGFHNLYDPDAQSRTAPNQAAISQSPDLYGSAMSNAVRADGQGMGVIPIELAASQFAPGLSGWYAAYRGMKAAANKAFDLRNSTKEDMTRFLMSRANLKGGASEPSMKNVTPPGQPPQGASGPGPQNALAPQVAPSAGAPQAAPVAQNSIPMFNNPTVGGAVAGGMAGGSMAQDLDGDGRVSMQERYVQGSLGALTGGLGGRAIGKLDDRMISQGSRQVLEGRAMPNGAGGKGQLPMDEASRLARAREMGFDTDTVLYHGTDADFEAFAPKGRARHRNAVPNATYLSNLPDVAEAFTYGKEGAQTMPLYVRGKMKRVSLDDPALESVADFAARAENEGFAGIQLDYGDGAGGAIETIIFDPSSIRSKYAQFDPAQSDSPALTAGIGGRRRKDVMKDVMSESQGARVPGTSRPLPMKGKDAPAAPAYRDDLTTAAVVGLPVGGAAGAYAYSMYKAEMYKRGQKDIPSFQEFMRMIEQEQRSRMGVPPRPGLKPQDLPQRVQGQ